MPAPQDNRGFRPRATPVPTSATGKLPPRDRDLEAAVLGAVMLEKDAYMEVSDLLVPDSFYEPAHQKIYHAIAQLALTQQPIDMITVTEELRREGTLQEVGGPVYIAELTTRVMSAANVEFHARIVAQKYLARRLITFASTIEGKAFDEANDVDDLLQEAEGALFEISQTQLKREVTQIDPVLNQAMMQMQAASNRTGGVSGLASGYPDIDRITSGWQNSDLVIIAARPAMGKTAFVLSMAKKMAVDLATPVAMFSLEMSNVQLVNRLISNACSLPGEKIKSGQLTPQEWDNLRQDMNQLYGAPFYLDETPGLSITELRTKARRLVREHQVGLIMRDYLQLLIASGMNFGSRQEEVSNISRALKQLAKELNIPILALSQLNRGVETRQGNEGKRPQLSDLDYLKAIDIEQNVDLVIFIHRPEYYGITVDENGMATAGVAELIIAKHRNGAVTDIRLKFLKDQAQFADMEDISAGSGEQLEDYYSGGGDVPAAPAAEDALRSVQNTEFGLPGAPINVDPF